MGQLLSFGKAYGPTTPEGVHVGLEGLILLTNESTTLVASKGLEKAEPVPSGQTT